MNFEQSYFCYFAKTAEKLTQLLFKMCDLSSIQTVKPVDIDLSTSTVALGFVVLWYLFVAKSVFFNLL